MTFKDEVLNQVQNDAMIKFEMTHDYGMVPFQFREEWCFFRGEIFVVTPSLSTLTFPSVWAK